MIIADTVVSACWVADLVIVPGDNPWRVQGVGGGNPNGLKKRVSGQEVFTP